MLTSLSRYGPDGEASPGKLNFGVGTGGSSDESSGNGGLEADQLLFRPGAESPLDRSLVGGKRVKK